MKFIRHLLRIVGVGIAIWLLSLLWLDINQVLMWPLFAGFIAGMTPAYLLGRIFSRRYRNFISRPVRPYTRPAAAWAESAVAADPTRPSPVITRRDRASTPTRPMPAV